jgi:hypothetical protein
MELQRRKTCWEQVGARRYKRNNKKKSKPLIMGLLATKDVTSDYVDIHQAIVTRDRSVNWWQRRSKGDGTIRKGKRGLDWVVDDSRAPRLDKVAVKQNRKSSQLNVCADKV